MVSRGSSDSIRFSAGEQMIAQSNMPNFGWARGNRRILALETIAIKGESPRIWPPKIGRLLKQIANCGLIASQELSSLHFSLTSRLDFGQLKRAVRGHDCQR